MERIRPKDLPKAMRPYEKCEKLGPESLTDAELLAVILRTGSCGENSLDLAARILSLGRDEGLLGLLHHSFSELLAVKGVGQVKAVQLLCVGELSKRIWKKKAADSAHFFSSSGRHCRLLYGRHAPSGKRGDPGYVPQFQAGPDL